MKMACSGSRREIARIGIIAVQEFQIAAAREDDRAAVFGPGDLAEVLAVIILIGGEPASFVIGCGGDPQVARAAFVENPDDFAAAGSGVEFGSEGRAEILFDGGRRPVKAAAKEIAKDKGRPKCACRDCPTFCWLVVSMARAGWNRALGCRFSEDRSRDDSRHAGLSARHIGAKLNFVKYVALMRGINVGGKNMLPMKDLVAMFVAEGCTRGVDVHPKRQRRVRGDALRCLAGLEREDHRPHREEVRSSESRSSCDRRMNWRARFARIRF